LLRDHAPEGHAVSTNVPSSSRGGWLGPGLRCRRARSASACFCRPSGAARRSRCRFVPCQRCTSRRHSGSRQYRWFHCRARYLRPHPLRRQFRQPSRLPLTGTPPSPICCNCPTGGCYSPGAARGGSAYPPRALSHWRFAPSPLIPEDDSLASLLVVQRANDDERSRPDACHSEEACQAARRKPGRRRTRDALGSKDTNEGDHLVEGRVIGRRGKQVQGRITPQGHAPVRAIFRPKLTAFSSPRPESPFPMPFADPVGEEPAKSTEDCEKKKPAHAAVDQHKHDTALKCSKNGFGPPP